MSASRRRSLLAGLLIPLATWLSFPEIQWCPSDWSDARLECLAGCTTACTPENCRIRRETASQGCDGDGAMSCDAVTGGGGEEAPAVSPIDPSSDDRGRAWCLGEGGGPALPAKGLATELRPTALALHFLASDGEPEAPSWLGRPEARAVAMPRSALARARPPVRAPPESPRT